MAFDHSLMLTKIQVGVRMFMLHRERAKTNAAACESRMLGASYIYIVGFVFSTLRICTSCVKERSKYPRN